MYGVIVIGGGPAGIMASIMASSNNNKVLLIEKNDKLGKKLELTGGGRCNLTNLKSIDNFIKEIPVNNKFLYSALNQFGPQDIYNYFTKIGVPLKVETYDRVFPKDDKSKTIIDALHKQMLSHNVTINFNEQVISIENEDTCKKVITNKEIYQTKKIIITTGGCSYPETGSTGDGYKIANIINQEVTSLYPAETFLIYKEVLPLVGITLDNIVINFNKTKVAGPLLFTHNGLSGPTIYKISEDVYKQLKNNSYVTLNIDLIPNYTSDELLNKLYIYNPKKEMSNFIREYLPRRLAEYISNEIGIDLKVGMISNLNKQKLVNMLKTFKIDIKGTGTISQGIVTGGGINIKYINFKTMESTINKGVYFAGEVLDVHGHTGGYNITIALSTGYAAGNACK